MSTAVAAGGRRRRRCSDQQMRKNILKVYRSWMARSHTLKGIISGVKTEKLWWSKAVAEVERLSRRLKISHEATASLVAVLSPRCRWEANLKRAESVARAWLDPLRLPLPCTKAQAKMVAKIMSGVRVPFVVSKRALKVRDFYVLLAMEPSRYAPVCVDRHTAAVAYGRPLPEGMRLQTTEYRRIAHAYTMVAMDLAGWSRCELQAVCWCEWRRLKREPAKTRRR